MSAVAWEGGHEGAHVPQLSLSERGAGRTIIAFSRIIICICEYGLPSPKIFLWSSDAKDQSKHLVCSKDRRESCFDLVLRRKEMELS